MRSIRELFFLSRDFLRYVSGTDYFRQAQGLGAYFHDRRCYYNDLRGKAAWKGTRIGGLPAYYYSRSSEHVLVPITILNYGLGSIDALFTRNDRSHLPDIQNVATWLLANILPEGYYNNRLSEQHTSNDYYSHNSSMVQGEVLSFGARAVAHELVPSATADALRSLMGRVFSNMILSLEENGTTISKGNDLIFCEFCRKDEYVVLNGWIYTYFGLRDYVELGGDPRAAEVADVTLRTLVRHLPAFEMPNGWALYDNKGRICSPFYQELHIALMDAMARLTGDPAFADNLARSRAANTPGRRLRYTASKVVDKLLDPQAYGSQS